MAPQLWHRGVVAPHASGWLPSAPFEGPSGLVASGYFPLLAAPVLGTRVLAIYLRPLFYDLPCFRRPVPVRARLLLRRPEILNYYAENAERFLGPVKLNPTLGEAHMESSPIGVIFWRRNPKQIFGERPEVGLNPIAAARLSMQIERVWKRRLLLLGIDKLLKPYQILI